MPLVLFALFGLTSLFVFSSIPREDGWKWKTACAVAGTIGLIVCITGCINYLTHAF